MGGFFLLLCNCSQCLTRVYALALIAMAVCITIAEAITIAHNFDYFKNNSLIFRDYESWSAAFNGLNSCVMIMQFYILLISAFVACSPEYNKPSEVAAQANKGDGLGSV